MTLDITLDFETCALCPTAAVLSIGAVAWKHDDDNTPFFTEGNEHDDAYEYSAHIDLRRMFLDGFTFDPKTSEWWSQQSADAKKAVLAPDNNQPCDDIVNVLSDFFSWIETIKVWTGADDVCLWSQGSDFDIAILRNICCKYNINVPIRYTGFRDHRTFFLEGARLRALIRGEEFNPKTAYQCVETYAGHGAAHDPLFDCKKSIYSTWQMLHILKNNHQE